MVQVLVTVREAGPKQQRSYQMLECEMTTTIAEVKRRALEAAVAEGTVRLAAQSADAIAAAAAAQEMMFLGESCKDEKQLADYGICEEWIKQVAGFILAPRKI